MALTNLLDRVAALDGVRQVVLAGREGLAIETAPRPLAEAEALAALGGAMLGAAEALGAETRRGPTVGVVTEYADALICVEPLGEFALVVARLDAASALAPLRQALRQIRGEALAALDAR